MTALNMTVLLKEVADNSKLQSIRQATPHNLKLFKVGKPIKLYTGMRRRDYCKNPESCRYGEKVVPVSNGDTGCTLQTDEGPLFWECGVCQSRGAKLLNSGIISEVLVVKFKDLTQEMALLDGFKDWIGPPLFGTTEDFINSALDQLKYFLIKAYNAQPNDEFLVIRWIQESITLSKI